MGLEEIFSKDKGTQKFWFLVLGFTTIILIVFSFQYLSKLIPGVKDNYNFLFCQGIK